MGSAAFTQVAFRIRYDNGTEITAGWQGNQDINVNQLVDTKFRVRFLIDETASKAWTNKTWNLYYSLNGGAYTAVSGSTPIQYALSDNFAQGDNTTTQLTGGSGSFLTANAAMVESGGAINSGAAGNYFDLEGCLLIDSAQVSNGDTLALRIYDGSNAIASYTSTPSIAAIKGVTASLSKTQDDQTKTITALVDVVAALGITQDDQAPTITALVDILAALAIAQADQTISSDALVDILAALAKDQDDQQISSAGVVTDANTVVCISTLTQDAQVITADGQVDIAGAISQPQADQIPSITALVDIVTALGITQDDQAASIAAAVDVVGSSNLVQVGDTIIGAGQVIIGASLGITQDDHGITAAGQVIDPSAIPILTDLWITMDDQLISAIAVISYPLAGQITGNRLIVKSDTLHQCGSSGLINLTNDEVHHVSVVPRYIPKQK